MKGLFVIILVACVLICDSHKSESSVLQQLAGGEVVISYTPLTQLQDFPTNATKESPKLNSASQFSVSSMAWTYMCGLICPADTLPLQLFCALQLLAIAMIFVTGQIVNSLGE